MAFVLVLWVRSRRLVEFYEGFGVGLERELVVWSFGHGLLPPISMNIPVINNLDSCTTSSAPPPKTHSHTTTGLSYRQ